MKTRKKHAELKKRGGDFGEPKNTAKIKNAENKNADAISVNKKQNIARKKNAAKKNAARKVGIPRVFFF